MNLENKIVEVMQTKGLNVDQLARLTELPRMTIYNSRKGTNVTLKTAFKIANALGLRIEDIWTVDELNRDTQPQGEQVEEHEFAING